VIIKAFLCVVSLSSREFGLEVNTEKTKCMIISHHQNAGQNHTLLVANKSFENVSELKYFRTSVTNQNCILKKLRAD